MQKKETNSFNKKISFKYKNVIFVFYVSQFVFLNVSQCYENVKK